MSVNRQGNHQQHSIFISVIDDGRRLKTPGSGPFDRPRRNARRQPPFHTRRLAGIARINPIDVPAFLELKEQAQVEYAASRDPLILGDEFERAVRDRRSTRMRISRAQKHEPQREAFRDLETARRTPHPQFDAEGGTRASQAIRRKSRAIPFSA